MASPVVESVTESATTTAGTSHIVNMPATRPDGDLYIVVHDIGSTAATWTHTGWTELLDEGVANGLAIAYRVGSSEPASYTFTTSANTRSADAVYRISGAEAPGTQAPEIGTTATGTSTTPDPPAAVMTGGSKDYLVIALFGMAGEQADDDTLVTTFPTSYSTGQVEKTCGVAGTNLGGMLGAAARALTASAENPGTFTAIDNAAWRAQTITVHPATIVDANAEIAWTELEVPNADARADISWAELEVPNADARADISWAEFEVPNADARADISWTELEIPDVSVDANAEIAWTEFEIPNARSNAEVAWTELEIPDAPVDADAEIAWAELEVPQADANAEVAWTEFEVPTLSADANAEIAYTEFAVPGGELSDYAWVQQWISRDETVCKNRNHSHYPHEQQRSNTDDRVFEPTRNGVA